MKYTIYFLMFILGIIYVFFINSIFVLSAVLLLEILLSKILRISLYDLFRYLKTSTWLLLSVIIINSLFLGLSYGFLLTLKLIIITIATFINSKVLTVEKLGFAISNCLFFLKNKEDITLIIVIAVSFVPIFNNIINNIKLSLKAKNFKFSFGNILLNGHILFITFFNQIFKKTDELELLLISRGFNRN